MTGVGILGTDTGVLGPAIFVGAGAPAVIPLSMQYCERIEVAVSLSTLLLQADWAKRPAVDMASCKVSARQIQSLVSHPICFCTGPLLIP